MSKSSLSRASIGTVRDCAALALTVPRKTAAERDERAETASRSARPRRQRYKRRVLILSAIDLGDRMSVETKESRGALTSHSTDAATVGGRSLKLDLELEIKRPPRSVRAWWTDLPDDYVAKDPREQPHRIRVLARK